MSGVVELLSVRITSALAIKPSAVYVMRVDHLQTYEVWHSRRCFSEFGDLRDRIVMLMEASGNPKRHRSETRSSFAILPTTRAALRVLGSGHPSDELKTKNHSQSNRHTDDHEHFPYIYDKFPRRQFFGFRTKRVIEHRTVALNTFLQEALHLVREAREQNNIAVYFSLMTQLETFFDCAKHTGSTAAVGPMPMTTPSCLLSSAGPSMNEMTMEVWMTPTNCDHKGTRILNYDTTDTTECSCETQCHSLRPSGRTTATYRDSSEDEDLNDLAVVDSKDTALQPHTKTTSRFMAIDVQEHVIHKMSYRDIAITQTRESNRDLQLSAAEAWAARIEIAGITSTLRASKSSAASQESS